MRTPTLPDQLVEEQVVCLDDDRECDYDEEVPTAVDILAGSQRPSVYSSNACDVPTQEAEFSPTAVPATIITGCLGAGMCCQIFACKFSHAISSLQSQRLHRLLQAKQP
jgi:hypothetical protein